MCLSYYDLIGRNLKKLIVALRIPVFFKVIENIRDTMYINLKRKENIEELMVEWKSDFDYLQNEGNDMNVLELLWARRNLTKFIGEFYRGRNFPKWTRVLLIMPK